MARDLAAPSRRRGRPRKSCHAALRQRGGYGEGDPRMDRAKRDKHEVNMSNAASDRRRAIVIGASMGGICAARALTKHFDEIVVLDRDDLPETPDDRRGVPQARHYHTMLGLGQRTLEGWFPGLDDALLA